MASIEKAIRNALSRGDAGNRNFREKVYRSAFGALDRSIAANPNVTEAIAQRRRQALLAAITAIETEFVPAKTVPAPQPPSVPDVASPQAVVPQPAIFGEAVPAPVLDGERLPLTPSSSGRGLNKREKNRRGRNAPSLQEDVPAYRGQVKKSRGRGGGRGLTGLFVGLVLVAGLATAWWLAGSPVRPVTSPQNGENMPPLLPGEIAALERWIDIFIPADPTSVAASGDSRAEVMEDDDGQFLRIRSGASGTPVLFDIGQGVLEQIAGRRAVFSLSARGADGQSTQLAVDCNLDELGDCGRKRYDAGASREEFLFEMDLPSARVTSGGTIAINPDLDGAGRSLDIYAIRVLPEQ